MWWAEGEFSAFLASCATTLRQQTWIWLSAPRVPKLIQVVSPIVSSHVFQQDVVFCMKMCFLGAWDNQLIFPRQLLQSVGASLVALSPRRSSYLRAKHCLPNFEMLSSQLAFWGFGEPWILQSFCWSFSSQFPPRTARRDFCMPLAEHMRLDPCRIKAELVQLPVAKELYDKQGQKIHD